ncbi:hypothetical protein VPH35_018110 [Triticum aestivum]
MSRPCCHDLILIMATVIFFAAPPLARAAAAKLADVDDHGGNLPANAIYLVLLRGEPHLKAPRRRQHDNATWYHDLELRAQEKKKMMRQRARLHDGILRRAMAGAGGSKYRKLYSFHHGHGRHVYVRCCSASVHCSVGFHVASIAVGNRGVPVVVGGTMYGFASGMAPHARLAVYMAMYPAGGTTADLISAIDQCKTRWTCWCCPSAQKRAHRPRSPFLGMLDVALLFARRAGVFVAQAAGNGGPAQSSVTSYSPWATTVAAGTTGRTHTPWLVLGNGQRVPGIGLSAPTPGGGLLPHRLIVVGEDEECQDAEALRRLAGEVVRRSVVVCSFSWGFYQGTSTLAGVVAVAEALGFAGFVLLADARHRAAHPVPHPRWYGPTTRSEQRSGALPRQRSPKGEPRRSWTRRRYSSRGPDLADAESTPADVLAPGDQIWAAWSALSANEPILAGDHFAMISGTSMAAPHVGGVAALIKQQHPSWGRRPSPPRCRPPRLRHDNGRRPIMAKGFKLGMSQPATPFDCGAGFINPAGAMDPGLVLESGFDDYISFLCSLPQLSPDDVQGATGATCQAALDSPADLNLPPITVSVLQGSLTVRRRVTNAASNAERYLCSALPPDGVAVGVRPGWFDIAPGETQEVVIELNVSRASGAFSFGDSPSAFNHMIKCTNGNA